MTTDEPHDTNVNIRVRRGCIMRIIQVSAAELRSVVDRKFNMRMLYSDLYPLSQHRLWTYHYVVFTLPAS